MNVLLINGSPHEHGTTYVALSEVARTLNEEGIDTEIFHIGTGAVHGCIDCHSCGKLGRCVFQDDPVNTIIEKAAKSDGFIFGAPVHYAGLPGRCTQSSTAPFMPGKRRLRISPARRSFAAAGAARARRLTR